MAEYLNDWTPASPATPGCLPSATFYPEPGVLGYVRRAVDDGAAIFKVHLQVGGFPPGDPQLDRSGVCSRTRACRWWSTPAPGRSRPPTPARTVRAAAGPPSPAGRGDRAPGRPGVRGVRPPRRGPRAGRLDTTMAFTGFFDELAPFPRACCPGVRDLGLTGRSCWARTSRTSPIRTPSRSPRSAGWSWATTGCARSAGTTRSASSAMATWPRRASHRSGAAPQRVSSFVAKRAHRKSRRCAFPLQVTCLLRVPNLYRVFSVWPGHGR